MAVAAGLRRALLGGAVVVATALSLAACASGDGAGPPGSGLFGGSPQQAAAPEVDPSYFLAVQQCPEVEVRTGTESLIRYDRGDETPDNVRWQASIRQTARECRQSAGVLTIKVGVAGRVAAGPKGREGQVNVPLRIALTVDDEEVAFSRLYEVPVVLAPPTIAGDFAHVEEAIAVPLPAEGQRLRLYVGFDPGPDGR